MQTSQLTNKVLPLFSIPTYVDVGENMPDVVPRIKDLPYKNYSKKYRGGEQTTDMNILESLPSINSEEQISEEPVIPENN